MLDTIPSGRRSAWQRLTGWLGDWHNTQLAWMVLGASAVISVAAWYLSSSAVWHAAHARFEARTNDIRTAIETRMHEQQVALKGGVGLFNASDDVSRDDWRAYFSSLEADRHLPGLQGFGYAVILPPEQLAEHEAAIRADGFPDFKVRPVGDRPLYSSIVYLEPFDQRNRRAFGYDMWSEPTRRAAMMRARDTGEAAVSGMVTLVQETDTDVQRGFLMYLPLYEKGAPIDTVAQRRAALKGFVYSPFRIRDLISGIVSLRSHGIDFRIYDGVQVEQDRLLFDSLGMDGLSQDAPGSAFYRTLTVDILGQPWRLELFSTSSYYTSGEAAQPMLVAAAAVIVDILLFFTIMTLGNQKRNSLRLVEKRTAELRLSMERAEQAMQRETRLRIASQEAGAKLQEANQRLTQFASIVAHDLRAPLKRIECFVDVLDEDHGDALDAEARDVMGRISGNANRMRQMLDSLHRYTRVCNYRECDETAHIDAVVRAVIEGLGADVGAARFHLDIAGDAEVRGDQYLLQHVMQNLISNAIKFRGDSPPNITITAARAGHDLVEITVTDDGIGVEPEFAERIFEMFVRLHNEDEYEGTGIGLAVCKKVVTDHGGAIAIDTAHIGGARVVLTLRAAHARSAAAPLEAEAVRA